jgi:hypothetical protein
MQPRELEEHAEGNVYLMPICENGAEDSVYRQEQEILTHAYLKSHRITCT